jgi:hypothetical protein
MKTKKVISGKAKTKKATPRKIKTSHDRRIDRMVLTWKEQGRAFSTLKNDDADFFNRIKVSPSKVGITSVTGNDLLYYCPKKYASDTDAIRKKKID